MAGSSNRERLSPGLTPNVLPWCYLTSHDMVRWLQVSHQTLWNWGQRSSGPPRRQGKNRRVLYRLACVQAWLDPGGGSADDRIRAFLVAHERQAALATWDMRPEAARAAQHALVRLATLSEAELTSLCEALDKVRSFGPKPKDRENG